MTETLSRPSRPSTLPPRRSVAEEPRRSPLAAGAAAALWAALAGLLCVALPVLLVWAADSRSGMTSTEVLRSGGRLWLLAHGASLDVPGGRFALTPLGLLLLPLALVARFARNAARDLGTGTVPQARRLAFAVALPYAVLALLVAVVCTGPDVHVSPVQSLLAGLLVGGVGAFVGAVRGAGLWSALREARSPRTRRLTAACAGATALLVGAAALLVAGSLALHFPQAVDLARASEPGALGGAALLLACLALVPNALVWGVTWLAGPGFAVGVGTAVSPFDHELGAVPALPLLAALPGGGIPEWAAVLVLGVPVLAGAIGGTVVATGLADDAASWRRTVLEALPVGPLCGLVVGLLAWLSRGAAGGDRLVEVGPSPWSVALAVTATVAVGAGAGALVRRARLLS